MKNSVVAASLVVTIALAPDVFSPAAYAGGDGNCHFHGNAPAKESIVTSCANQQKDTLIGKGKIDASWKSVKLQKAETVDGKSKKEWKMTFNNPAEKDPSKQTLYMFYTLSGNFIAANFTGQ